MNIKCTVLVAPAVLAACYSGSPGGATSASTSSATATSGSSSGTSGSAGTTGPATNGSTGSPMPDTVTVNVQGNGEGTVISNPSGINCSNTGAPGACSASFPDGSPITLNPMWSSGSVFTGWQGNAGCSGMGPCTLLVRPNLTIVASFGSSQPQGSPLTVVIAGDGAGSVTSTPPGINCNSDGGTCTFTFPTGTSNVVLTASPGSTSTFAGWNAPLCNNPDIGLTCPVGVGPGPASTATAYFSGWQLLHPFPSSTYAMTQLGGTMVAVGTGAAVTSTDGGAWTGHNLAAEPDLRSVCSNGRDTLVAVGDGGVILSSTSLGSSWSIESSGVSVPLFGAAYGNGVYVAVGGSGTILSSTDGAHWSASSSGTPYDLLAVSFGLGQFVAVGYGGTILTSPDGAHWTAIANSPTTQFLSGLVSGSNQFVAVGNAGTVLTSPDGATWTQQTSLATPALRSVAYRSGTPAYLAVGDSMGSSGTNDSSTAYTSNDGIQWTAVQVPTFAEPLIGASAVGSTFFATGPTGSIYSSTDGATWTAVLAPGQSALNAVAYGSQGFVAAGAAGTILFSPDGEQWTATSHGSWGTNLEAVAYGDSTYAVAGNGDGIQSFILASADGLAWSQRTTLSGFLTGMAYDPDAGFAAVGQTESGNGPEVGAALSSPDGLAWSSPTTVGLANALSGVTYGGGLFIAVGQNGGIYSSASGRSWTPQASPTADSLTQIVYGNGVFVALDGANLGMSTLTSTNGIQWTPHSVSEALGGSLAFGNGEFLSSALLTSPDGAVWTSTAALPPGFTSVINGGLFAASTRGPKGWVGVGLNETIALHP